MRTRVLVIVLLAAAAPTLSGQSRMPRVEHFGFGAAVLSTHGVEPAAQISAAMMFGIGGLPIEIAVGSSTGDLRSGAGTQHDAFIAATRVWRASRYLLAGAGVGLHRVETTISAADGPGATTERDASGFRPALGALVGINMPLSPRDAAALQLTMRGALMRGVRQLSLGLGVHLAPGRGHLMLGESASPPAAPAAVARSWDAVVQEVMLLENRVAPLWDVLATRNALVMKLGDPNVEALRDAVTRIARILNGSAEDIDLQISAPEPAVLASAATAAGFPPERIVTAVTPKGITLQATRRAPATATRTAR